MPNRFLITVFILFASISVANADWFSDNWPTVRERIEELTPQEHRQNAQTLDCVPSNILLSPSIGLSPEVSLKLSYPEERYLRACDPPEAPRYSIYYREGEIIVYSVYTEKEDGGEKRDDIGSVIAREPKATEAIQRENEIASPYRARNDDSVLKEWIYTEEPNMPTGSRYSWDISGAQNVVQDDEGRVIVSSEKRSYIIDPVVYWTRKGGRRETQWEIEAQSSKSEVGSQKFEGRAESSLRLPRLSQVAGRGAPSGAKRSDTPLEIASAFRPRKDDGPTTINDQRSTINDSPVFALQFQIPAHEDAYPLLIDPTVSYGQWLGGAPTGSPTQIHSIVYGDAADEIYIGGLVRGGNPEADGIPSSGSSDGSTEGFVIEISDGGTPSLVWRQWLGGSGSDSVIALAVTGDEIYAAGDASDSSTFEAVSFQGTHDSNLEGFVVEIGDGGTPTLVWGQWLGASTFGASIGFLAVTGDEIYAAGQTSSETGFDLTPEGTHSGGNEGFVVELLDGVAPLTLWGQWLGGTGNDHVYALAVNGDEIYAGGYVTVSTSFEAVTFQGAQNGVEGFVIEIGDGGVPTLVWGQWLGGTSDDRVYTLAVTGDEVYAGGYSSVSTSFEAVTFQGAHIATDGFVIEIGDGGTPTLVWGQWLGGSNVDSVSILSVSADEIYAAGTSLQSTSFESVTFQGAHSGGSEGFVVEIGDGGTPTLVWGQWLGGSGDDLIEGLAVTADEIYAGGYSLQSTLFEAVTFQGTHSGDSEGFVIEIGDGGTPTLVWGQWQGTGVATTGEDQISSIAVAGDEIYAGGRTVQSTSFETVTFQGAHSGGSEGFVVEIGDGGTPSLAWGQWLGGDSDDYIEALAVTADEIYAGGYSTRSTSFEAVTFQGAHIETEGFVVEIGDGGTPTLVWGQWLGGNINDFIYALAVTGDEIYAGGTSSQSTSWEAVTFQGAHVDFEGFVVEIGDGGTPTLVWGQRLGGSGIDQLYALAVTGDEIYAGGMSVQSTSWEAVTFQGAHILSEGFVVEIGDGGTPTLVWGQRLGGSSGDNVYALAVEGDEIYAGGTSNQSTSWEAVTFQGAHIGTEGFVVEIGDGGTPTLVWGQRLGGSGNDIVYALAVTGDEIYAGGVSIQSTSWEAVTFQGAHNNNEGFVVEIGDGGTPTLVWGQWLGGSNDDIIYALAVTDDELYAGGETLQSTSFESGTFQGAHSGGSEGFLIEIFDVAAGGGTSDGAMFFGPLF